MTSVLLLPDPAVLALVDLEVDEATKTITATAQTTSPQASCPVCGHPAHRVQSNYVRTLADQPCSGQRVRWLVQVRRFWCDNGACGRKIFSERLATCAPAYARRTVQLATILCELAFALGGKAGERVTPLLGMAVSHDTLLRLMKRHGLPTLSTPQVLGVDDFAWKKGRRYGNQYRYEHILTTSTTYQFGWKIIVMEAGRRSVSTTCKAGNAYALAAWGSTS